MGATSDARNPCGSVAAAVTTGPPAQMPPLSPALEVSQDYYRIGFSEDGFPGRRDETGLSLQPIYGVYVLNDYLKQYTRHPSQHLADAISMVADASVRRMNQHRGTLVFWYEPDARFARVHTRHYSGLTQAYYAVALHRAGQVLDEPRLRTAAGQVFDSLLVPTHLGGVYQTDARGVSIAEVPQQPNSWILNGWQSVLVSVHKYAQLTGSAAARDLFEASAETMASVLPLFDAPKLRNSRYGLSGFLYCRLRFLHPVPAVRDVTLEIPGEGVFPVERGQNSRWQCYAFEQDVDPVGTPTGPSGSRWSRSRTVRMNLVLSRASHPYPNVLNVRLRAAKPTTMAIDLHVGHYNPLSTAPVRPQWRPIASHEVSAGEGLVSAELQWADDLDLVGYPTTFLKELEGSQTNVYHPLHVKRLRELHAATNIPALAHWAEVWSSYICDWVRMGTYRGLSVCEYSRGLDVVTPDEYCRRNIHRSHPSVDAQ